MVVLVPTSMVIGQSSYDIPQTNLAPIGPPATNYAPPGSGYGQFDPYSPAPNPGFGGGGSAFGGYGPGMTAIGPPTPIGPPTTSPVTTGGGFFDRLFSSPVASPPPSLSPSFGTAASGPVWNGPPYGPSAPPYDNASVYGPPIESTYGAPPPGSLFPSTAYPSSSPSTLFPGGLFGSSGYGGSDPQYSVFRLLQGPRMRHTYVGPGSGGDDLETNDTDLSVVFAFPNFLYSQQPVYVVPSFSLHLWDGPGSSTGADLPANAYSGFIDAGWQSDPNQMLGTEFGLRVGVFTDFETYNSDSIRIMGKALVAFRLTPTSTLKGGVYYLDRLNYKLIPAGGILWQPNPYTRADIFFPEPKFSRYFRTIGTKDVWWYVTGAYGGGAWTIQRDGGGEEGVDINDFRVITGFEWGNSEAIRTGRRTAFFEVGYVFDRQIEYFDTPGDNISVDDAFMFRAGFGY